ncbi:MAG: type II toxin-antitoxin system HicB family antitoxin [Methylobacteriaceae bacterium]|nr:type II toxin-antitoxin system HicB family antitoxin [Methylobacteriaceae bacterium]
MRYYIGIVHKDPTSDFGVLFPDFPGCISAGDTLAEAAALAREALLAHIAGMIEDGEPIPEPMTLEAALADPLSQDGVPILVPLPASYEEPKAA